MRRQGQEADLGQKEEGFSNKHTCPKDGAGCLGCGRLEEAQGPASLSGTVQMRFSCTGQWPEEVTPDAPSHWPMLGL